MAQLSQLLQYLMDEGASDLLVKVGSSPHMRRDGRLQLSPLDPQTPSEIEAIVTEILSAEKAAELQERGEVDTAHGVPGLGRFRINVYRQRGSLSLAIRRVLPGAPALSELNLPPVVGRLSDEDHGLILVTGPATSGRTTTVAAMIDQINASRARHIITLEDPIEVLHADKKSLISQREIGSDIFDLSSAVSRAGRQNADVVFVSEIRDAATAAAVMHEAAAGRLVVSTMSTHSAAETVSRYIEFFELQHQHQARQTLSNVLKGIVSQRLLERDDGHGRVMAVEVLVGTLKVADAIATGEDDHAITQIIRDGEYYGMQTFDQSLFQLYRDNLIGTRDALSAASRPEDLRITLQQADLSVPS